MAVGYARRWLPATQGDGCRLRRGMAAGYAGGWLSAMPGDSCRLCRKMAAGYARMFTARETTRPIVTSETSAWMPIVHFAIEVSGIVSVGENAIALVSDTYR